MGIDRLPARAESWAFHVVVEAPRGSSVRLKYDPDLGVFRYSRPLVFGVRYPFEWGFVPSTLAPDGDPLDAMVLTDEPTAVGVVIECRALGVMRMTQRVSRSDERQHNNRLIAVPRADVRWEGIHRVPDHWRAELEVFFRSAGALEGRDPEPEGWGGADEGERLVDRTAIHPSGHSI